MRNLPLSVPNGAMKGKGKVVNYFSENFEWIVRFSGGAKRQSYNFR